MQKQKINYWTAGYNIFASVINVASWFIIGIISMYSNSSNAPTDIMTIIMVIGLILNIIAAYYSHKNNISMTGAILGIIGSALSAISFFFALPSLVLLILSTIFLIKQKAPKTKS